MLEYRLNPGIESISWFSEQLAILQGSPLVNLIIHSTSTPSNFRPIVLSPAEELDLENKSASISVAGALSTKPTDHDAEKNLAGISTLESTNSLSILPGRPDISKLIKDVVSQSDRFDRIAIVACGPDSLTQAARDTAAECITISGPSINFHSELFG